MSKINAPVRIGLVGAGHLGKIHLRCLAELPELFEVVGFFDSDPENAAKVAEMTGIRSFGELSELIEACDALDVVAPTVAHFSICQQAIERGRHFFVEKPLSETVEEGRELARLAQAAGLRAQVGHVERFNPAHLAVKGLKIEPVFIEVHRLAAFQPRGTDVSVVLDLMIHDLDLVLHWVKSPIRAVSASGVAVLSATPDIANARLEFENGCTANLTASRISFKQMRKARIFQPGAYFSLDFLEKKAQVTRLFEPGDPEVPEGEGHFEMNTPLGRRILHASEPSLSGPVNAIKMELEAFGQAILSGSEPPVPLADGLRALEAAHRILAEMRQNQARFPLAGGENGR